MKVRVGSNVELRNLNINKIMLTSKFLDFKEVFFFDETFYKMSESVLVMAAMGEILHRITGLHKFGKNEE